MNDTPFQQILARLNKRDLIYSNFGLRSGSLTKFVI